MTASDAFAVYALAAVVFGGPALVALYIIGAVVSDVAAYLEAKSR